MSPPENASFAEGKATIQRDQLARLHVVFLVNFVAPNLIAVMQQLARRVEKLTILSSVEMETNRDWQTDWDGLNVIVQKTWTITRETKHPSGFQETNYIHLPLDTIRQLRRLDPHVVISLEMGARSIQSWIYCRFIRRRSTHVLSVYASQRSEAGRGVIRNWFRKRLIRRATWVTHNGPSCRRLLIRYGADPDRMSAWDYAADPRKRTVSNSDTDDPLPDQIQSNRFQFADSIRLLTVGQLSQRKGVTDALRQVSRFASTHPDQPITWNLVGDGPLKEEIESTSTPANLHIVLQGHLGVREIASAYASGDVLLFPTLADEWGLVVDEAMASGMPVIGSCHSQAVETLIEHGVSGWIYDPEEESSLQHVLHEILQLPRESVMTISTAAFRVARHRTPERSADQLAMATLGALGHPHRSSDDSSREQGKV